MLRRRLARIVLTLVLATAATGAPLAAHARPDKDRHPAHGGLQAGNRTSKTTVRGGVTRVETAVIASASNRMPRVRVAGATVRDFDHDADGRITRDERVGGADAGVYAFTYTAAGRMMTASLNGVVVGRYGYDWRGLRVRRVVEGAGGFARDHVFDLSGRLLAEHDAATGAVVREYVWLDDLPLAAIDAGGAVWFIHAGALNEPLVMTGASGAVAWDSVHEPFGLSALFGPPSAVTDLRLPGQQLQLETGGLHQNWMRDYDPSTGRYIQPDPLGLAAGQNLYGYVEGDPVNRVDPLGLQSKGFPGAGRPPGTLPGTTDFGVAFAQAVGDASNAAGEALAKVCPKPNQCPPCKTVTGRQVAVGTIGYRWDHVGTGVSQHGIVGDHLNFVQSESESQ